MLFSSKAAMSGARCCRLPTVTDLLIRTLDWDRQIRSLVGMLSLAVTIVCTMALVLAIMGFLALIPTDKRP